MTKEVVTIIGGGLAGCEAAWQLAQRGLNVRLFEMRPAHCTPAHQTDMLAELVCSNSLGTTMTNKASGLLKAELDMLGSLLIRIAYKTRVPAGNSLAVDRESFSGAVTRKISEHPNIEVIRNEKKDIPDGYTLISSGPLTSRTLSDAIQSLTGEDNLFFFDALAPIVAADTIDMTKAFRSNRYQQDTNIEGDFINCPLTEQEYHAFISALLSAKTIEIKDFETNIQEGVRAGSGKYFEGCLPIEVLAKRGENALAYGPMRPVGLFNPRSDKRPYAVLQLRQDNLAASLYNLVGFQTNLTYAEQDRVLRKIPALEHAEFLRYGQMHRNTFILSPVLLDATMQFRTNPNVFFAGQITGVEGYAGNIASGLIAGLNMYRSASGKSLLQLPQKTMCGALFHYISHASVKDFQPMKANFGLLPQPEKKIRKKTHRYAYYARRALENLNHFIEENNLEPL